MTPTDLHLQVRDGRLGFNLYGHTNSFRLGRADLLIPYLTLLQRVSHLLDRQRPASNLLSALF